MIQTLLILPFGAAIAVLLLGVTRRFAITVALGGSFLSLAFAIGAFLNYRLNPLALDAPNNSYDINAPWITALNINLHFSMDGLSAIFVLLTAIITCVAVLTAVFTITERMQAYLALLLFLEGALIGVFLSLDLVLFYFYWEAVLIPAYFMIGAWGGPRRVYAAFKYVLYTMIGSLLMLVGILLLYAKSSPHSFNLLDLMAPGHLLTPDLQRPVFLAFGLAFAIKAALFPFHSWVPDVYTEAETPTTIILSGVLSKMGIFGFLRICLPLFPDAARYYAPGIMVLAVIGIIYGAFLALEQRDGKRLVACGSIAHLGFITLGIFSLTTQGVQGAILQALNHGITIAALFAIVAVIAARWGTRDLTKLTGMAARAPIIAAAFLVIALSALGLPGLNSFAGEFLILLGTFRVNVADAVVGTIGVVFAAAYMLRLFQDFTHGPASEVVTSGPQAGAAGTVAGWWMQMSVAQYAALLPLIVLMVWIGVDPSGWLDPTLSFAQSVIKAVGGQP